MPRARAAWNVGSNPPQVYIKAMHDVGAPAGRDDLDRVDDSLYVPLVVAFGALPRSMDGQVRWMLKSGKSQAHKLVSIPLAVSALAAVSALVALGSWPAHDAVRPTVTVTRLASGHNGSVNFSAATGSAFATATAAM